MAGLRETRQFLLMAYQDDHIDDEEFVMTSIVRRIRTILIGHISRLILLRWTIQNAGASLDFTKTIYTGLKMFFEYLITYTRIIA